MQATPSERRLAENEAVFRKLNEQVHIGFEETNRLAREDNQPEFHVSYQRFNRPLHFYCECSDEKCAKRIRISVGEYQRIHESRDRFIVVPEHDVEHIEKIIDKNDDYWTVEKNFTPPESANTLHPTPLQNV